MLYMNNEVFCEYKIIFDWFFLLKTILKYCVQEDFVNILYARYHGNKSVAEYTVYIVQW